MAAAEADEADLWVAYASTLERAILLALDALRAGDVNYARRLLSMLECRIREGLGEMDRTLH